MLLVGLHRKKLQRGWWCCSLSRCSQLSTWTMLGATQSAVVDSPSATQVWAEIGVGGEGVTGQGLIVDNGHHTWPTGNWQVASGKWQVSEAYRAGERTSTGTV